MANPEDIHVDAHIEFPDLVAGIVASAADGGVLTTGPGAERHRERLIELGGRVAVLSDLLLEALREMMHLNDENSPT